MVVLSDFNVVQFLIVTFNFLSVVLHGGREVLDSVVDFSLQFVEALVDHVDDRLLLLEAVIFETIGSHIELHHAIAQHCYAILHVRRCAQLHLFECI